MAFTSITWIRVSGELTYAATVTGAGTIDPSFLDPGPDKGCLYVVNEFYKSEAPNGTISAFAIDPVTGHVRYLNQPSTHGTAPCYASIEPQGRYCRVERPDRQPLRFADPKGRQPGRGNRHRAILPVPGPIPSVRKARMPSIVLPSPDGGFILAVDLGTDRLMAFRLDRNGARSARPIRPGRHCRPAPAHAIGLSPPPALRLRHQRTPFHGHRLPL